MALDGLTMESHIARSSWRPNHVLNSMISIHESIPPTVLQSSSKSSSIGFLDNLPAELLQWIFNLLDFRSLSRLAQVCHGARGVVGSLPAYRDLVKHASKALIALSRTKLITFHSAASIYAVLHSENCLSCQNYGPFLFLPTCERCCYECLHRDRSLRVIPSQTARMCFGVSPKDLRRIPAMLSIPGTYSVGHGVTRRKSTKLVSLKQAKELGIAVHGSEEAMSAFVALQNAEKLTRRQLHVFQWLTAEYPKPLLHHPSNLPSFADTPDDGFCGMASIGFPSLQWNGVLENGLWCYGCRLKLDKFMCTVNLDSDTELLVSGSDRIQAVLGKERRARSKSEFIKHMRECKNLRDSPGA